MLYKFHNTNQNLYNLLLDTKLWFSKASDFNDPFDMQIQLNLPVSKEERDNAVEILVDKLHTDDFRFDKNIISEVLKSRSETLNLDTQVHEYLLSEFKNLGVCCFSKDYNNILLWSHYTGGHKGVCLGFDFNVDVNYLLHPLEVTYTSELPLVENKNEILKGLLTKSTLWSYENEFRIITPSSGLLAFSKNHFKEIIFGAKCSETEIQRLKGIIGKIYNDIVFKKAIISKTKYELEFEEI